MAVFLAEIAFLLALALFALGLVLWHQGRQASAGLLRGAGAVLVVGAVVAALSTGYFSVRYQTQRELDRAYLFHPGWGAPGFGGPRGGGWGMPGPGMMGRGMMDYWAQPGPGRAGSPSGCAGTAPGAGGAPAAQPEPGSGAKPNP
jgi:hypothetical protein